MDTSFADYTNPGVSDVFVNWNYYSWCYGKIPCYSQFETTYNWGTCQVWCVPVAYAMVYWYYDRKWDFPNLFPWVAWNYNDNISEIVIEYLWKINLWTYCKWSWWATKPSNLKNWINYAISRWYDNSYSDLKIWNLSYLFNILKYEINNSRPIIANTESHSMVAFWYYNTNNSDTKIIRLNLWFGNSYQVDSGIFWINVDYNMDSIFYNWENKWWIESLIKVVISN